MYVDRKPELQELYLAHHGVKGMKWGVRHDRKSSGHNRPKRFEKKTDKFSNERQGFGKMRLAKVAVNTAYKAGDKASEHLRKSGQTELADQVQDATKKLNYVKMPDLNIGREILLGVGSAALLPINPGAAIGVGTVTAALVGVRLKNAARSIARTAAYKTERDSAYVDSKTGLKLKSKELDSKEDMKRVNPMYGDALKGSKNNCMACSIAYDMRRRGYEVRAKNINFGLKTSEMQNYYKDSHFSGLMRIGNALDEIRSQPDGARGAVSVRWTTGGGHSMAYEVNGGKVTIIDSQTSKRYSERTFRASSLLKVSTMGYTRLDNCTPDIDLLRKEIIE